MVETLIEGKKFVVVGTGTMGVQIAQLIALNRFSVVLKSRQQVSLDKALKKIASNLQKCVDTNKLTQKQVTSALTRISGTTSMLKAAKNCSFMIESIVEDSKEKKRLLKDFEQVCPNKTIICSNTSSLSITDLSQSLKFPQRFVGLHFLNPAFSIKLVEIIRGKHTSQLTVDSANAFAECLGKSPVIIDDSPGFLVNRMLIPMINEAVFILQDNLYSREQIDSSMKLGAKHPIGPLALGDLIGLDVCLSIMRSLNEQFQDPKYLPCPLLVQMVNKNLLGRKTKKGFYNYS